MSPQYTQVGGDALRFNELSASAGTRQERASLGCGTEVENDTGCVLIGLILLKHFSKEKRILNAFKGMVSIQMKPYLILVSFESSILFMGRTFSRIWAVVFCSMRVDDNALCQTGLMIWRKTCSLNWFFFSLYKLWMWFLICNLNQSSRFAVVLCMTA